MQLARRRAAWPAAPAPPRGPRCWRRVTVRAAPPPDDARGHSPAAGGADDPLPLVTQLEGDKDGSETFVTSAGVVQDVEEEDARVWTAGGGGGGRGSPAAAAWPWAQQRVQ